MRVALDTEQGELVAPDARHHVLGARAGAQQAGRAGDQVVTRFTPS